MRTAWMLRKGSAWGVVGRTAIGRLYGGTPGMFAGECDVRRRLRGTTDPDAGSGGFAEMDGAACDAEGEGLVVLAFGDDHLSARMKVQAIEKFEELAVFFVHADDFGGFAGVEIGEQDGALFAELGEPTAEGNAVRAGLLACETFQEKRFNFGRDGVFETFGFVVSPGPG